MDTEDTEEADLIHNDDADAVAAVVEKRKTTEAKKDKTTKLPLKKKVGRPPKNSTTAQIEVHRSAIESVAGCSTSTIAGENLAFILLNNSTYEVYSPVSLLF